MRAGVQIKQLLDDETFMQAYDKWISNEFTQRMLFLARRFSLPTTPSPDLPGFADRCNAALHESVGANGIVEFLAGLRDLKQVIAQSEVSDEYQMQSFLEDWNFRRPSGEASSGSPPSPAKPSKKATRVR